MHRTNDHNEKKLETEEEGRQTTEGLEWKGSKGEL